MCNQYQLKYNSKDLYTDSKNNLFIFKLRFFVRLFAKTYIFFSLRSLVEIIDVVDFVEFNATDIFVMLVFSIVVIYEVVLISVVLVQPEINDLFNI
jgi:hypothetical protein